VTKLILGNDNTKKRNGIPAAIMFFLEWVWESATTNIQYPQSTFIRIVIKRWGTSKEEFFIGSLYLKGEETGRKWVSGWTITGAPGSTTSTSTTTTT
jgi:hypothetical protein